MQIGRGVVDQSGTNQERESTWEFKIGKSIGWGMGKLRANRKSEASHCLSE